MKNNILLRTNIIVCVIIVLGFAATSLLSYYSNRTVFERDIEDVSALAVKAISSELDSILALPADVSLSMAEDTRLKSLLSKVRSHKGDAAYAANLHEHLNAFKANHPFDSAFAVTDDGAYYHYNGRDRILDGGPEDVWFTELMKGPASFNINIDNDQADDDAVTIFFNRKLEAGGGAILGIAGIGIRAERIQSLLEKYKTAYNVNAYLIDYDGNIQLSAETTSYTDPISYFSGTSYAGEQAAVLDTRNTTHSTWYHDKNKNGYFVSHYISDLDWYLIVDSDTTERNQRFHLYILETVPILLGLVLLLLLIITRLIRKYNARISELTVPSELEYHRLLLEATAGLYDNIFEWNITQNSLGGESTKHYLSAHFGISPDTPYDDAIRMIAEKQIKPDYIQGYLDLFTSAHVLEAYADGGSSLSYDLMINADGGGYRWMRITARIFFWPSDQTVHLISYRQNIDAEKQRELALLERSQRDPLTGLFNRRATEELIALALSEAAVKHTKCALFIFDVDDFKIVNDNLGHSYGDHVLHEFSIELQAQFRDTDIIGRIGGDEFVVFMRESGSPDVIHTKLSHFFMRLKARKFGGRGMTISSSIGVALYPEHGLTYAELFENADHALYFSKGHGKSCYHICGESTVERPSFRIDLRDIETLLNTSMDGVSKIACVGEQLRVLYFNTRRAELTGTSPQAWFAEDYKLLEQIHPDDALRVFRVITAAIPGQAQFRITYRLHHSDGHYIPVLLRGLFVNELYENKYPIFYAVYTNLSEFYPE